MAVQTDVEYFARLVDALEPWLDQVVIIGVWHTASTACILCFAELTFCFLSAVRVCVLRGEWQSAVRSMGAYIAQYY